ncbi:MAG: hypothetical protein ACLTMP_07810 [Eggerthella lenta]
MKKVMRSIGRGFRRSRAGGAAQALPLRWGLKGDEAGAVISKKATTVYKYEAGTLWIASRPALLLNEYGVNMVTAF